jgi:hypothetical protein
LCQNGNTAPAAAKVSLAKSNAWSSDKEQEVTGTHRVYRSCKGRMICSQVCMGDKIFQLLTNALVKRLRCKNIIVLKIMYYIFY